MGDEANRNDGCLVPAGRRGLAPVAAANSLVSRALMDLAQSRLLEVEKPIPLDAKDIWAILLRGIKKRDCDAAIRDYSEAVLAIQAKPALLGLDPCLANALIMRGNAWREKNCYDNAIDDFTEAIRLVPNFAHSYSNRATAWQAKKEYQKARKDFEEAIRVDPKNPQTHQELAWFLATCPEEKYRDGKRAIQLATIACELTEWKRGLELDTLAAAFAEVGQFDEAERFETKALEDPGYRGPDGDEFRQRLELYAQTRQFRQHG